MQIIRIDLRIEDADALQVCKALFASENPETRKQGIVLLCGFYRPGLRPQICEFLKTAYFAELRGYNNTVVLGEVIRSYSAQKQTPQNNPGLREVLDSAKQHPDRLLRGMAAAFDKYLQTGDKQHLRNWVNEERRRNWEEIKKRREKEKGEKQEKNQDEEKPKEAGDGQGREETPEHTF